MKVTALIPDQIIKDVAHIANGKNLTESIQIALKEWIEIKKISHLNRKVQKNPLSFRDGYTASKIRKVNRQR